MPWGFRPSKSLCEQCSRNPPSYFCQFALRVFFFFNARMAQESMGMFTVAKMWLIFLDQIRKMTPRVLWLCRRAACPSSNETRRQRAWSASLNIDAEQRGTRATSRICFFKSEVHGYWKHYAVKSLEVTHPHCPLLSQTLLILLQTHSTIQKQTACFAFCHTFVAGWTLTGRETAQRIYISKLHRDTLFIN